MQINPKSVFVVIPSYNEAQVIVATMKPLIVAGYQVVLVDDCSTDNTREVMRGVPQVHYVRHPVNLGQGAALQTGMEYACRNGAEFVIHFDADGQHDAAGIPAMLEPILAGRADITMGTRFKRKEDIDAIPAARRNVLRVAILANAVVTGMWLTDAHCGFRALNRLALSKIHFTENRMAHATEILSIIRREKLRLEEVPVHIVYTEHSRMKGQSSWNSINILMDLILNKLF